MPLGQPPPPLPPPPPRYQRQHPLRLLLRLHPSAPPPLLNQPPPLPPPQFLSSNLHHNLRTPPTAEPTELKRHPSWYHTISSSYRSESPRETKKLDTPLFCPDSPPCRPLASPLHTYYNHHSSLEYHSAAINTLRLTMMTGKIIIIIIIIMRLRCCNRNIVSYEQQNKSYCFLFDVGNIHN